MRCIVYHAPADSTAAHKSRNKKDWQWQHSRSLIITTVSNSVWRLQRLISLIIPFNYLSSSECPSWLDQSIRHIGQHEWHEFIYTKAEDSFASILNASETRRRRVRIEFLFSDWRVVMTAPPLHHCYSYIRHIEIYSKTICQ